MSTPFIRRGIVSASRLATPPPPPSIYQPVGTQHVWWADDLVGVISDGSAVATWTDSVNSQSLTKHAFASNDGLIDYNALNDKPTFIVPFSESTLMESDISSLTYTQGSIFFILDILGSFSQCIFTMSTATTSLNIYMQTLNSPNRWNVSIFYDNPIGVAGAYANATISRTGSVAVFELQQGAGPTFRVNGTSLTFSDAGSFGGLTLSDITPWVNNFDDIFVSLDSNATKETKMPVLIITDEDPTDRADFQTWATDYYGL